MKYQLTLSGIFLVLASMFAGIFSYVSKDNSSIKVKAIVTYSLLFLLLLSLLGLFGLSKMEKPLLTFINVQSGVLILGVLHCWLLFKINRWPQRDSFWPELVFTMFIGLIGLIGFIWVFGFFNGTDYLKLFSFSVILFSIPFLFLKTFDYALEIPALDYPKWHYSQDAVPEIETLPDDKVIVVALEFFRNVGDPTTVKSRAKAPLRMEFGSYFALFINEYNEANIGNRINYLDHSHQSYGWTFYKKPKWWQFKRYIDPKNTLNENKLAENDIIIAERHQIINN